MQLQQRRQQLLQRIVAGQGCRRGLLLRLLQHSLLLCRHPLVSPLVPCFPHNLLGSHQPLARLRWLLQHQAVLYGPRRGAKGRAQLRKLLWMQRPRRCEGRGVESRCRAAARRRRVGRQQRAAAVAAAAAARGCQGFIDCQGTQEVGKRGRLEV